ncbi:hypothetical protein AOLI_G00111070 [Acnodon oligacanthus]
MSPCSWTGAREKERESTGITAALPAVGCSLRVICRRVESLYCAANARSKTKACGHNLPTKVVTEVHS